MDTDCFDTLARSLNAAGSRRGALAALLGGTLGLLDLADTTAKKKKKKGKKKKGGSQPTSPPPPSPPAPTCVDGIKNGSESDVDCGGASCPRCANGQGCASQNDCVSVFCANNVCRACLGPGQCGTDSTGSPLVCLSGSCVPL